MGDVPAYMASVRCDTISCEWNEDGGCTRKELTLIGPIERLDVGMMVCSCYQSASPPAHIGDS